MTMIDNIRAGRYENKVPYTLETEPVDEDRMTVRQFNAHKEEQKRKQREQRDLHRAEDGRLNTLFRTDLEAEFSTAGHPKAQRLWEMAWDRGHSSGYESVFCEYQELAELIAP